MNEQQYSIGTFAKETGLSVRTLHYYDEIGLLTPKKNPNSGHRIYKDDDIKKLHKILVFKDLGYRLDEIKSMVHTKSFDMSLKESLSLQQQKLEAEKEKIESSLSSIRRTIAMLEEEREVDSDILISLIFSMQTESDQRKWLEKLIAKDAVKKLYDLSEEEKMKYEKTSLYIYKEIKRLSRQSISSEEVKMFFENLIELVLTALGMDSIEQLRELFYAVNGEEMDGEKLEAVAKELEKLVPSPLTMEENDWIDEVMAYYIEKWELKED